MTAFKIQNFGSLVLVLMFHVRPSRATFCVADRFGPHCEFKCRCQGGCKLGGECKDEPLCMSGYFGPFCQYEDVINNTDAPLWLKDSSNETCNPSLKEMHRLDIALHKNMYITWLRMIVRTTESFFNIKLTFNDNLQPCINQRNYIFDSITVDVTCDNYDSVENIRLTGTLVRSLCRLHISGGRNVALGQPTNQSGVFISKSVGTVRHSSNMAVDGIRKPTLHLETCMITESSSNVPPTWSVFYRQPHYLFKVSIVSRNDVKYRLKGFTLETYNYKGKLIDTYQDHGLELGVYNFMLTSISQPVSWVTITGASEDNILTLCEVETYGEVSCPEHKWGFHCSKDCGCPESDSCFVVTGKCSAGCSAGYYGFGCLQNCSKLCVDNICSDRNGHCLSCDAGYTGENCSTECPLGSYGVKCESTCSETCRDDKCNNVNGTCKHCDAGFFGKYCSIPCPESCHDKKCRMIQGSCFSCNTGYYGQNCSTPCPENCQGKKCRIIDGECFSCNTGYYEHNCTKPCPSGCSGSACHIETGECLDAASLLMKYLLFELAAIPMLLLLICLFACVIRGHKESKGESELRDILSLTASLSTSHMTTHTTTRSTTL